MGERDLGAARPAPAPPRAPRLALGLGLVALLALVLAGPPSGGVGGDGYLIARPLAWLLELVAPARAAGILGVLALAAAAVVATVALERRFGGPSATLVLLLIFGSGVWALVWTAGGELVSLALAVAALALAYGGGGAAEPPGEIYRAAESGGRLGLRWLAAGLLLAGLVPAAPLTAGLVLPAALAVPAGRRRAGLTALAAGWVVGLALELAFGGAEALVAPVAAAAGAFRFDPALAGWNLLYLGLGRHVGLLAGFAPLLLLLALGKGSGRGPLAAVGLGLAVAGALLQPFDFAGGRLNLAFLPLYGALWLLPARPPRGWEWLLTALVCGLLSWPLWLPPWAAAGEPRLAAAWPRRYLPYETSLRGLPGAGDTALGRSDLRARAVRGCRLVGEPDRFELAAEGAAELWLAAPPDLEMVALEFGPGAGTSLEVDGAEVGRTVFRPDGRIGFELRLTRPRARHPLWFGESAFAVHLVTLRMPARASAGPLRFRLLAPES